MLKNSLMKRQIIHDLMRIYHNIFQTMRNLEYPHKQIEWIRICFVDESTKDGIFIWDEEDIEERTSRTHFVWIWTQLRNCSYPQRQGVPIPFNDEIQLRAERCQNGRLLALLGEEDPQINSNWSEATLTWHLASSPPRSHPRTSKQAPSSQVNDDFARLADLNDPSSNVSIHPSTLGSAKEKWLWFMIRIRVEKIQNENTRACLGNTRAGLGNFLWS